MTPTAKLVPLPRPAWWGLVLAALLLALALVPLSAGVHTLDRLAVAAVESWQRASSARSKSALPAYRTHIDARPIAGVGRNLSGLAFDPERDRLWAVVNDPPELLALSKDGAVLDRHALHGFSDVEGVAWLDKHWLLVVEERRQTLVLVPVPGAPGAAIERTRQASLRLALAPEDNAGFEGVAYDRAGDRLFVVKEHSPRKLYEVRGLRESLRGALAVEILDREAWIGPGILARDFSSVEFDARSGHLLLLSDASKLIIELDAGGRFAGYQPLAAGFAGLGDHIPQAEGVALAPDGALYVVSEPNLFYAFRPE